MSRKYIYIYLSWLIAAISTAGSIFLSNVMDFPPCNLCWYQRIFMFPLVVILWNGYALEDRKIHYYALPFILSGFLTAIYHNLLYYKWISVALIPCTAGASCTERQLNLFGFLSIPMMSLGSFTLILILMFVHLKKQREK